jgi:esterase/lipase superfamily enzyme
MADDFVITVRNLKRGNFDSEPGPTRFLKVPEGAVPAPAHRVARKDWADALVALAKSGADPLTGKGCGDITVLVHGYSTSPGKIIARHRQLRADLAQAGYRGQLASFDWPSDDHALNYLEDRVDAKLSALKLVDDGIALLTAQRYRGCEINVHVVAHSMGCYMLREAFDDADDRPAIAASNWNVSQVCFVAADVSRGSMSALDARTRSLYRHCNRLTNYQNPFDAVLKLSDVKRVGVAPRAGRRGLPPDRPDKAVNVDCGAHFSARYTASGDNGHSWYFTDPVFIADLVQTLAGNRDREVIAARRIQLDGGLALA